MNLQENNKVWVAGEIVSSFAFHHEVFGEGFYQAEVSVQRLSGAVDVIPITVSDRLVDVMQDYKGAKVAVSGQFRSYNQHDGTKSRLMLSVFAQEISLDPAKDTGADNRIELDGFICKAPVYRKTPRGRIVADMMLAVGRAYGKSDYIPCICWGRDAAYVSGLGVGTHVKLAGRIQSREYVKTNENGEQETRTAYEVSASWVDAV